MHARRANARSITRGFRDFSGLHPPAVTLQSVALTRQRPTTRGAGSRVASARTGRGTWLAPRTGMSSARWALLALASSMLLTGCATSTRIARMGPLPSLEPLVTLIVSDDRRVVEHECRDVPAFGPILGCSTWRTIRVGGTTEVKVMKV